MAEVEVTSEGAREAEKTKATVSPVIVMVT